jgi:hypothetical protein
MARRTSRTATRVAPKAPVVHDTEQVALRDAVIKWIDQNEATFTLKGPVQGTMMMADGGFKVMNLTGSEELLLSGARLGAKHQVIFEFTPMDSQLWARVEWGEEKVFEAIKEFDVVAALGHSSQSCNVTEWMTAAAQFRVGLKREAIKEKKVAEVAAKAEQASLYADDAEWGSF